MSDVTPAGGLDRLLAVVAYLGPLVALPLFIPGRGRFLAYHTRQALYVFATAALVMLLTLGLLYVFYQVWPVGSVFQVLAVLFLMEAVAYVGTVAYLGVQCVRGKMPMLPVLGELAGEA